MADEVDLNKIAALVLTDRIDKSMGVIDRLSRKALRTLTGEESKLLKEYLRVETVRRSRVRTILYRDVDEPIDNFYVSMRVRLGSGLYSESDLLDAVDRHRRILVAGTAGAGKSFFLRKMFLLSPAIVQGRVPVFLEARKISIKPDQQFESFLAQHVGVELTTIEKLLGAGKIILFIDGVDEVESENRRAFDAMLMKFTDDNRDCVAIISSRPDARSPFWSAFSNAYVAPMEQAALVQLVHRLRYDPAVKDAFLARIGGKLYEDQAEFLGNPLLATVMLMTFREFSDFPERVHEFYRQAFETLFKRHDFFKEAYVRDHKTGLNMEDFRLLLESFSAHTYLREVLWLTEQEAVHAANWSIKNAAISCSPHDFLEDAASNVCILGREGDGFSFLHRSMQEYFTACFIERCEQDGRQALIQEIASRRPTDNALLYLRSMARAAFERDWAIPTIAQFLEAVDESAPSKLGLIAKFFPVVVVGIPEGRIRSGRDISVSIDLFDDSRDVLLALEHAFSRPMLINDAVAKSVRAIVHGILDDKTKSEIEAWAQSLSNGIEVAPPGGAAGYAIDLEQILLAAGEGRTRGLEELARQLYQELISLRDECLERARRAKKGVEDLLQTPSRHSDY